MQQPAWMIAVLTLSLVVGRSGAETVPSFEKDVLPILTNHCLTCHGGLKQKNGLDLRSRSSILQGGMSGPAIKPGALAESLLWQKVSTNEMPKGDAKLSAAEQATLRAWIAAGAPSLADREKEPLVLDKEPRRPAQVAADIDRIIDARLAEAKVPASPRTDDGEFLRRVYLDLTGCIPTAEQAVAFLDSTDPDRRSKLVEELLASPRFGQHFGTLWHNLMVPLTDDQKRVYDDKLLGWLADALNQDRGWDQVVTDLLTAEGSVDSKPQVGYFVANPEPGKLADRSARLFLGIRLECAECHNHPLVQWKQTDYWGTAAFFAKVTVTKPSKKANQPAVAPSVSEAAQQAKGAKGKTPPRGAAIEIPATALRNVGQVVRAQYLGGQEAKIDEQASPRPVLAAWITDRANPYFDRAQANRLWSHFFGRGLVNPLDELHDTCAPSHPALLRMLAHEFEVSGRSVKHLVRCICASQAYQRSSRVQPGNEKDSVLLSRMPLKVMAPEMLYDSLTTAFGTPELFKYQPPRLGGRAQVAPMTPRTQFVNFFNHDEDRTDTTDYSHGVPQALRLMNMTPLNAGGTLVDRLLARGTDREKIVEGLYLATLSRRPGAVEQQKIGAYVAGEKDAKAAYRSILWILINSSEFVFNR
jgi:hypothetical protein